jgi:RNA polymerase sigma factor
MGAIDDKALLAANDEQLLSEFIQEHKRFIINCAYRTTNRYITDNDDEWSIALIAFSNAVKTYDQGKGSFLAYAELIIKRNLIDYFRSQQRHKTEILVRPEVFESPHNNEETEYADINIQHEINEKVSKSSENHLKDEIEAANGVFRQFGFSFFDLADCSPKSKKTKEACRQAVLYLLDYPLLITQIFETKQLPTQIIQKNTDLPRKILEHHRRYIIAAIVILSGEYPLLAEYISFIRKEGV